MNKKNNLGFQIFYEGRGWRGIKILLFCALALKGKRIQRRVGRHAAQNNKILILRSKSVFPRPGGQKKLVLLRTKSSSRRDKKNCSCITAAKQRSHRVNVNLTTAPPQQEIGSLDLKQQYQLVLECWIERFLLFLQQSLYHGYDY